MENKEEPNSGFSESTKQLLDELAKEKSHNDWLKTKRKERLEYLRGWITWITAAWALKDLLWDAFMDYIRTHLK